MYTPKANEETSVEMTHALVRAPASAVRSVVAFQGPQAYVTPSWYPSKVEHGKTVPTWNYAVVHARGVPTFIQDRGWLLAHVSRPTDAHEVAEPAPWAVADALADLVPTNEEA